MCRRGNDEARVIEWMFLLCHRTQKFGGYGKLRNGREVHNTRAGIGRDPIFLSRPFNLCKRFIREPPLNSEQQDFVRPVELESESHEGPILQSTISKDNPSTKDKAT